ncbi:restriction endonuclease subunit S [Tenacibaculum finnmarkense]|uniref:restriction endonuclease subunit S n=1 Tax=Tenacibaculum finnmarkense TaxID=2781243 RepID=UPI000C4D9A8D|nr:restriction endonuclease subunit S [Tenacibaculum finnmarkense]MCG8770198.1 restriction endonuclease subunit S [Tenacibaculum finnmarkense]MCG8872397.1 restriction endonuclease subunit S [Tenacibaculum finnmarkense]SOS46733.1 conserved hypothetical protein [Tenacibaculum finnmarkense]
MNRISLEKISKIINSGLTPLRSNKEYWIDGNIPWVKTEQLGDKYIYDSNEKITNYALQNTSIKLNSPNTLSIAMYGEGKTRGSVSILKNETTTNQACCNIFIDEEKADFEFVYYNIKTQYNNLRNLSSGVRKNLNSRDIKNFEILLPNLQTQKSIAKVLSDLDSKIAINNKINAALEAMAKTLYDYWFVQFDFPDKNGKPYKSSEGKMIFNEELKREIPVGWEVETLLSIANFQNGLACQKFRPIDDNFLNVIKIKDMKEGFSSKTEKVRVDVPDKIKIFNGDILFSWSASLEVIQWSGGKGALNQHIFKVTSDKYPKSYYYFELLNYLQHFKMMAELRKTTMGHITQEHLKQSRIVIPPKEIINQLDKLINPILDKINKGKIENQKLSELRDWLLPMLMNGQVRVGE